jgi:mannose-6-phosphate isomerase-like protein (cupin superfamily)
MVKTVKRPWGEFKQFVLNKKCTVKIIEVNPKQELSLQKHKFREEQWYFITPGVIQVGKKKKKMKEGGFVKIGKNTPHRLIAENGNKKTQVLEISLGEFREGDEIRLEDKYNRK